MLDSCARLVFALPPVVRFVELLALCEVERNGERDERCGFKRHDVEDNSALTVRSPLAGTGCACGAAALVLRLRCVMPQLPRLMCPMRRGIAL